MNTTHPNVWTAIRHTLDTRQQAVYQHSSNVKKITYISGGRLCMDCQTDEHTPQFLGSMTTSAAARLANNLERFAA